MDDNHEHMLDSRKSEDNEWKVVTDDNVSQLDEAIRQSLHSDGPIELITDGPPDFSNNVNNMDRDVDGEDEMGF